LVMSHDHMAFGNFAMLGLRIFEATGPTPPI
jgi:hypothetical protein